MQVMYPHAKDDEFTATSLIAEVSFIFHFVVCTNTGTDGDNMVTDGDPGNGGDNNGDPGNGGDNNSNGSVRGYIVPATMLLAVLISILSS